MAGQPPVVLVTRPEAQQPPLIQALAAIGAKAVALPTLTICAISEQQSEAQSIKNRVLALDEYQHLIFISTNAVQCGMPWIENYWPQLPVAQRFHAIGQATAGALAGFDIAANACDQAMNSESLLQHPGLQQLDGQRVLIFRGIGGRDYLAEQLRQRGAQVEYCEVYRRQQPAYDKGEVAARLQQQAVDTVIVNSVETLQNLLKMANEEQVYELIADCAFIVPSERVAQFAQQVGLRSVWQAENATVAACCQCLQLNHSYYR
jgi:uroporphyrinogen-III synthase